MELTVKLSKEQWEFILETINLCPFNQIKLTATELLKIPLDEAFKKSEPKK